MNEMGHRQSGRRRAFQALALFKMIAGGHLDIVGVSFELLVFDG